MTNGSTPDSIAPESKRAIVSAIRAEWIRKRYQLQVNMRVWRRIGATPELEAQLIKELSECEIALDELDAMLAEFDSALEPESASRSSHA